jgi:hypothetical protein
LNIGIREGTNNIENWYIILYKLRHIAINFYICYIPVILFVLFTTNEEETIREGRLKIQIQNDRQLIPSLFSSHYILYHI